MREELALPAFRRTVLRTGTVVFSLMLTASLFGLPQNGPDQPDKFDSIPDIDEQVQKAMDAIHATAGSLAISVDGRLVYSKGYGFSDRRQRAPVSTRATMRLASCTKPFTAAAIELLIERGEISRKTRVFDFLGIPPSNDVVDKRIKEITVADLLEHRGGWDREQTVDPMYRIGEIKSKLKLSKVEKRHIVRYMWDRPLQNDPGSVESYSNFGYLLLGLVIEKVTGKSYVESIRELVTEPIGAGEVFLSSSVPRNRANSEVWYPKDNKLDLRLRDSASGLVTNSETLCAFMDHFWMDGRKRRKNGGTWYYFQFGTHPFSTTSLMEQRSDGINFAILLNRRREEHYEADNEALRERLNGAIDRARPRLVSE